MPSINVYNKLILHKKNPVTKKIYKDSYIYICGNISGHTTMARYSFEACNFNLFIPNGKKLYISVMNSEKCYSSSFKWSYHYFKQIRDCLTSSSDHQEQRDKEKQTETKKFEEKNENAKTEKNNEIKEEKTDKSTVKVKNEEKNSNIIESKNENILESKENNKMEIDKDEKKDNINNINDIKISEHINNNNKEILDNNKIITNNIQLGNNTTDIITTNSTTVNDDTNNNNLNIKNNETHKNDNINNNIIINNINFSNNDKAIKNKTNDKKKENDKKRYYFIINNPIEGSNKNDYFETNYNKIYLELHFLGKDKDVVAFKLLLEDNVKLDPYYFFLTKVTQIDNIDENNLLEKEKKKFQQEKEIIELNNSISEMEIKNKIEIKEKFIKFYLLNRTKIEKKYELENEYETRKKEINMLNKL